jgi:hypothetical protein
VLGALIGPELDKLEGMLLGMEDGTGLGPELRVSLGVDEGAAIGLLLRTKLGIVLGTPVGDVLRSIDGWLDGVLDGSDVGGWVGFSSDV